VYRSVTRWTNCNGKQLCGTCIVDVKAGLQDCSRRSIDEANTLRDNPLSYRLSCITTVYGDVTVEVQTPVGASQWTR
jgi:ferredoxin